MTLVKTIQLTVVTFEKKTQIELVNIMNTIVVKIKTAENNYKKTNNIMTRYIEINLVVSVITSDKRFQYCQRFLS